MYTRRFLSFLLLIYISASSLRTGVFCDQLSTLSPGIMQFAAHPQGRFIAAQEALTGSQTRLSFYEFEKGNEGGKKPQLQFFSAVETETAQGVLWNWTNKKPRLCVATTTGKLSVYELPETIDEDESRTPILLGEKIKTQTIKAICWANCEDLLAIVLDQKLVIYAVDPESKKRPLKRLTSCEIPFEDVSFLSWSHDDGLLAVGNTQRLLFWKSKAPSGTFKLTSYSSLELDRALKGVSGSIKDIAWNKSGIPTIAILSKKLTLITFRPSEAQFPIGVFTNFATNSTAALAWNVLPDKDSAESQELIVTTASAQSYQVYTLTAKSLMFDTTPQEFLQPYKLPERPNPAENKFGQKLSRKHVLADEAQIELINKLAGK